LEALLLLRNEPRREWTVPDMAKALYLPEHVAGSLLADFVRGGFATLVATTKDKYAYRARDDETDRLIGELQSAYHDRRVAIISLIYSKPLNKVQTFADAFRFGKENPK
jgi:hypothetical protein